ncbi:hypothetical protein [Maribacter halichondriae]|uniref:hypothetical protein n=1 Tax=Maribacter halichondriae TaxID=2980554 RepID=UPI00235A1FB8|nr:hypothetical protein [Maribacter sp. Hal144]
MSKNIILRKKPKIEFQLLDNGFTLIDAQIEQNSGLYSYNDVQSIELNKIWFPTLAKWLRIITWIFNGAPYFPDAETCKKANLIIHLKKESWYMVDRFLHGW